MIHGEQTVASTPHEVNLEGKLPSPLRASVTSWRLFLWCDMLCNWVEKLHGASFRIKNYPLANQPAANRTADLVVVQAWNGFLAPFTSRSTTSSRALYTYCVRWTMHISNDRIWTDPASGCFSTASRNFFSRCCFCPLATSSLDRSRCHQLCTFSN